jgi:hypothetical protein
MSKKKKAERYATLLEFRKDINALQFEIQRNFDEFDGQLSPVFVPGARKSRVEGVSTWRAPRRLSQARSDHGREKDNILSSGSFI